MSNTSSFWRYNSTNVRVHKTRQRILHIFFNFLWHTIPGLSKRIAQRLFFTPSNYQTTFLEHCYLKQGKKFEISVHGQAVKCWQWGSGPGILLAHGWNGRGIQLHHFIEPLVGKGYAVIAYDAPGHGESPGKTSSYFEFTDTIRTLLNSSNGHNIQGIIAHSLGASATINSIAKENHSLEVVLIAPALRLAEILASHFDHIGMPKPIYQSLISEYEDRFGYNMHHDNPSNLLQELASRLFIVHDKNDAVIPYVDSQELAAEFQNITLHPTAGLGHKNILTEQSIIEVIVNQFRWVEDQEMASTEPILEEYRRADFDKRLNLFLECPAYRNGFMAIDQSEIPGEHAGETSGKTGSVIQRYTKKFLCRHIHSDFK